jgi:hypothetical protein
MVSKITATIDSCKNIIVTYSLCILESKARVDDKISWMQKHMNVFVTNISVV